MGRAFETECRQIDYAALHQIWAEQYQDSEWQFPAEEFDWRGVAKEYVFEVKGIVRANPELRALLETDLLETIAQNTAQVSPGFDIEAYRESLQYSYGYLKLYTLDSTDRVDAIKLWNIFVEQTVREALPPTRYELPLDLKRKLQDEGQLEEDLSPEALEHYRREYFERPARKVLKVVAEAHRAVVLGDPGSGKSSLLQYLAMEWVEGKTETLPLLVELREFAVSQCSNFLEFLHRGRGADWQFDQRQLHQHLLENPTLVMFDGLDEIFDRATQAAVVDDIVRFAQQYPQAKVLVSSRIIGYNPERLRHSGFRHFTMQSLDTDEIHEFIDRWYDLSMGSDPDKERLKQRLKDAIENSKAIQNLADNPLLLTMMAILNRRQELPRDRADLYDQASRVLLYHWDVDHKQLQLPLDAIGRREKQEMLRLISYEMQAGEGGLKGNLIDIERLTKILTDYLCSQGFSNPRDKANILIQQLRERNYILCFRGADTYGFVHRTFLEYFCAIEIIFRFEKQQSLTFEQLQEEIFGLHWQDETWHEVLQLICNVLEQRFTFKIIDFLIGQNGEKHEYSNIFLVARCLAECDGHLEEDVTSIRLLETLKSLSFYGEVQSIKDQRTPKFYHQRTDLQKKSRKIRLSSVAAIGLAFSGNEDARSWLETCSLENECLSTRQDSITLIAKYWKESENTLKWLCDIAESDSDADRKHAAVKALAIGWKNDSKVFEVLKKVVESDEYLDSRRRVIWEIDKYWKMDQKVLNLFYFCAVNDASPRRWEEDLRPRQVALEALLRHDSTNSKFLKLLNALAEIDEDQKLRDWIQETLQKLDVNTSPTSTEI